MVRLMTDLRTGVIEIVIGGFLQPADVAQFRGDLARETAAVRATGREQVTLYDYTDAVIQSQETVAALGELARDNPFRTRKTAIYTGGRLARRQACRVADAGAQVRNFDDRATALEWLLA